MNNGMNAIATIGAVPAGAATAASPRLRLTRRGRVVLTTLASIPVVIAAMIFALNGGGAVATGDAGEELDYVTVSAGQTLWSLAEEVAPDSDPRDVISDFLAVNQLESGLQAGQQLAVPARYSNR